ncbi:uncharacterized protein LOC133792143 [Humulus lupulus]|uniref:uncharacterized protein LOC133792143 n=1 Tax=Humulus lupulus TaxID=3486 RepID=UPI002B40D942|nr:uncharacterized protein LOC133792143 [Humulus lupulus]
MPMEEVQAIGNYPRQPNNPNTMTYNPGIEEEKSNEENVTEDLNKKEVVPPVSIDHHVRIPYPKRLCKHNLDKQFAKFLDVFKKLHINIPFIEALEQLPNYVKFMKEILYNKRKMGDYETVVLTEECSAILQRKLPQKLGLGEARPTTVTLQLADRSMKYPCGIIEDVLVKMDKFIFLADFIVLDIEEDDNVPIILGRPFLATGQALIDVQNGELRLRVQGEEVVFNVLKAMTYPKASYNCFSVDVVEEVVGRRKLIEDPLEISLTIDDIDGEDSEEALSYLKWIQSYGSWKQKKFEELGEGLERPLPSILKPLVLELKALPEHLRYAYIGEKETLPVIVSSFLSEVEEEKLLRVLMAHKTAIGWTLANIRGISPSTVMHRILMEEDARPIIDAQRRLNPTMKEVVSPVQIVPKKWHNRGENESNELIPTRTVMGWRICIDYRKLNKATRKYHFPLPFIDQMLDRNCIGARAKISTIENLPPPGSVKGVRSFLGHAGFYRRFIKDFSKVSKPLSTLLMNGVPFNFDEKCHKAFKILKEKLISAPIVVAPQWDLPFELMCDASNFAVGAVLGQRVDKVFRMVYNASRTLNDGQINYATTEKELLAIVFAFDKFRPYLIGNKIRRAQKADHLSRVEVDEDSLDKEVQINDAFPDEQLFEVSVCKDVPWLVDYVNFLAAKVIHPEMIRH